MKRIKKIVDERQEKELLRIEHVTFWCIFWTLFISIIVQTVILQAPLAQVAAEGIILMICCIGVTAGCIKKGQWDYFTKPGPGSYLFYSLISSFIGSVIFAAGLYIRNEMMKNYPLILLLFALIVFGVIFALTYSVIALSGYAVKKRRQKLEKKYSDKED